MHPWLAVAAGREQEGEQGTRQLPAGTPLRKAFIVHSVLPLNNCV